MIYSRVDLYRPSSSHLQKQKLYFWSGQRLTGFPKQAMVFTCLQYKSFEITVGKGEIARHETFTKTKVIFLEWTKINRLSKTSHGFYLSTVQVF